MFHGVGHAQEGNKIPLTEPTCRLTHGSLSFAKTCSCRLSDRSDSTGSAAPAVAGYQSAPRANLREQDVSGGHASSSVHGTVGVMERCKETEVQRTDGQGRMAVPTVTMPRGRPGTLRMMSCQPCLVMHASQDA